MAEQEAVISLKPYTVEKKMVPDSKVSVVSFPAISLATIGLGSIL